MKNIKYVKIIIAGTGPSGYTACIYISRFGLNPLLITGKNIGGQLVNTNEIENWPGLKFIISGLELMNNFFFQIKKLFTEIIFDEINNINLISNPIILYSKNNNIYICSMFSVNIGSNFKSLLLKNEKKYISANISFCAVCDGNFYKKKNIIIIGSGNSAVENTVYLSNIVKEIILISKNNFFKSEFLIIKNIFIKNKNIYYKLNSKIKEIIGDSFKIKYIKINNSINKINVVIYLDGLFISIGNKSNGILFKGQLYLFNNYIKIRKLNNYNFTKSNLNLVFGGGDIQDIYYKQAITASADGCKLSYDLIYYFNKIF